MLQQEKPEDFVIATGETTYIRDFVRMTFSELGIELEFSGEAEDEVGKVKSCSNPEYQLALGKEVVKIDSNYYRPTEVDLLLGDPTKANTQLGWIPKYDVKALCKEMIESDILLFKNL